MSVADTSSQPVGAPVSADQAHRVFIARQPIVDRRGRVFGYELLYRRTGVDLSCNRPGELVSAEVLTHALLSLGLDTLTGGRPAFVNFSEDLLLSGIGTLLTPSATVIEVLEGVHANTDVVAVCRQLHAAGFAIALDDFVEGSDAEALLPFARFVKVDVLNTPADALGRIAKRFLPRGVRLIAEKVEDQETVERARAAGYLLFQGYHFCRPTTISGGAVTPSRLAQVQLLAALADHDITIDRLETIVAHDVALTYRILRCLSSAAYGISRRIDSVRQALVLLGIDHVRKWAVVWSLAALNSGGAPEILTIALVRARCCELLGQELDEAGGEGTFFSACARCSTPSCSSRWSRPSPEFRSPIRSARRCKVRRTPPPGCWPR